jgi:hypothetical protein
LADIEYYDIVQAMLRPEDIEQARALERGDVANHAFSHAAHLRVAWVYLNEAPSLDQAIERMSGTLRRFVASVGKAEKYSESTTVFWMLQVAAARTAMPDADFDGLIRAYPRLLDKNLIRADHSDHVTAPGSIHPPSDPPDRPLPGRSA